MSLERIARFERYSLADALRQRRSRRFPVGGELPGGPLAYRSARPPEPLGPEEEAIVLFALNGRTGWHDGITYGTQPGMSTHPSAAGGRTNVSGGGQHVSDVFYTNDSGVYYVSTRDAAPPGPPGSSFAELVDAHRRRARRIADARLHIPRETPWISEHNLWAANAPGSTLAFGVADLAQYVLGVTWARVLAGLGVRDDLSGEPIRGLDPLREPLGLRRDVPLSWLEIFSISAVTAELASGAYAGALTLTGLGLGGWLYDGIDMFGLLGASGRPDYPGLGFRFDRDPRWATPNVTGLPGVFEAMTVPHHPDMHAAVDALVARKFGPGGPHNAGTGGPYRDTRAVRGSARLDPRVAEAVAVIAQHVHDVHGRFPATVPAVFTRTFLQAQHLDPGFYDEHFADGGYLDTHRTHAADWHDTEDD